MTMTTRLTGMVAMGWGAGLVWRGQDLFESVQGHRPSAAESSAVAILGTRHLVQGLTQVASPDHFAGMEAVVDFLHASSMGLIAAKEPSLRRATLTSGVIAGLFGVLAVLAAHAQRKG